VFGGGGWRVGSSLLDIDLSILFLVAVILIWFMIAYQLVLSLAGYFHHLRSLKERREIDRLPFDFPNVSILIPAHNEDKVIVNTLESMLKLDYPHEKVEIIVIDDGSTDQTAALVRGIACKDARVKLLSVPLAEAKRGKSCALNRGMRQVNSDYIAVYDADNTPERNALRYMMSQLLLHPELGAVLGKFRTANRKRNILTKFINIETLSFQSILQAGRWKLFRVATLPGTNFVVRRHLLEQLGGWDEKAITEDSELTIRIYMEGFRIKYVPYARTDEQEPEAWRVWVGQRTRWVRGNNYVISKFFKEAPRFRNKFLAFEVFYLLSLYYVFLVAILVSDILFILSAFGLVTITLPGPYTTVWILAIVLFLLEIFLALSYDREDTVANLLLTSLMYLTYCQFWIYVVVRALYLDIIKKEERTWEKTIRFDVNTVEDRQGEARER
jgi:cellulose synthase/poly-beta-1,6-N-acetylglucosamine synthase-like glycosyltransferase